MKSVLTVALFVSTLAGPALRGDDTAHEAGQFSRSDYRFACNAAMGGMYEVEAGKLAATKATDPEIKGFGNRMVADHGKAAAELKQVASNKGAVLPMSLDKEHQRRLERLQGLSGKDFDKAYVDDMEDDHEKDAKEFRKAAKNCDDSELRDFAARTAPVVEDHLKMAKDLDRKS